MESGSRSSVFDDLLRVVSSPGGKRTRKALEAIDAYALEFQANAPGEEEQAVLRLELDATFSCEHSGQVVSSVLPLAREFIDKNPCVCEQGKLAVHLRLAVACAR